MSLPKANYAFKLPSVHDDLELDCRLYYPRRTEHNYDLFGKAFAIFAHPYATLGGSYDDPVVGLAGGLLLRQGCVLITFNFRGASGSAGKTSWSGKPELGDYASVFGFALCYIDAIYRQQDALGATVDASKPVLILGGYSYGSMITSHLPARDVVLELFKSPLPASAENEIKLRAEDLSRDAKAYFDMHAVSMTLSVDPTKCSIKEELKQSPRAVSMGGYDSDAAGRRVSRESSRRSIDGDRVRQSIDNVRRKISHHRVISPRKVEVKRAVQLETTLIVPQIAYVLISPLLPPVAGFTTLFSKLSFTAKGHASKMAPSSPRGEFDELTAHPCLCIYGSKDVFTTDRKLQRWTEELRSKANSQFVAIRTGSSHFWQDSESIIHLQQGLTEWLKTLAARLDSDMAKESHRPA